MQTENFIKLINSITKKDFLINTTDLHIIPEKKYYIYIITPLKKYKIGFEFKAPKNVENLIKSFISTYCNKFREPNPANYNGKYSNDPLYKWEFFTAEKKEYCYFNHSSNMYNKNQLLEQIKENLNDSNIENILCKYGFYNTIYGVGIFVLFGGKYEINAINKFSDYLKNINIPFKNEYSNAKWVYRFVINIDKDIHAGILNNFYKTILIN
jgi:hypothetical protein